MIRRLLDKYRPKKTMYLDGEMYLERWYLGRWGRNKYVVLHRFSGPDPDRRMHTHPWENAYSFVLRGWYEEQYAVAVDTNLGPVVRHRKVRWFNRLRGMDMHRVRGLGPRGAWTLFFMGKRVAHWGFLEPDPYTFRWQYRPYEDRPEDGAYTTKTGTCPLWTEDT